MVFLIRFGWMVPRRNSTIRVKWNLMVKKKSLMEYSMMNVVKAGLIKVRYIMEIGDFPNDFFFFVQQGP